MTHAYPFPFLPVVMSPVFNSKDNFVIWRLQGEESFQTMPEWAWFFQGGGRKKQNAIWSLPENSIEKLKIERTVSF